MSIDGDDPEGRSRSAESEGVEEVSPSADDVALCRTVKGTVGSVLLGEGLSPQAVDAIIMAAVQDFALFRKSIEDPCPFLVKRILLKRDEYRKLRGMEGEPDPEEEAPHLLEVVRTQSVLETLSPNARIALEVLYSRRGTFRDVADELGVTPAYAKHFVDKILNKLDKRRLRRGPRK
jgi:hypothetical protein